MNHISIAIGIVQATAIFAIGDSRDNCQKLNIIIGKVKERAERVKINASFIDKKLGKK